MSAGLLQLAGLVFAAVSFIVFGDTAGKLLTAAGVDPLFVALSRFVLGAAMLLPFSGLRLPELALLRDWRVLLRGALIAASVSCILTALRTEPIANAFGAFFIGPVVSYVIGVTLLRERSSWTRFALMALGFIGVMLVVKPGFGATPGIGFALLAGCFYGGFLAITRVLAGAYRARLLLMSQLMLGSILLLPATMVIEIPDLDGWLWLLVVLSAAGSATGNYLLVVSSRLGHASLIAPLVYSQLITASAVGIIVFGDWPDIYALLGLSAILMSGLGSLMLAQRHAAGNAKAAGA